jgi:streptomycin 6-kinase
MIEVPAPFARETVAREGAVGQAWLDTLPELSERLMKQWELTLSGAAMTGAVGVALPVVRADGTDAVLKISFPHPGNIPEPNALAAWAGRGAVKLYERDDEVFAMLLERVGGGSLHELPDLVDRVVVAGRLNLRLAVPAPSGTPSLTTVASEWADEISSRHHMIGGSLSDRLIGRAIETCRELAASQPGLLVHGDMNFSNVLGAEREPWLVIDPKGWSGDPAYDAVNLLRDQWQAIATPPELRKVLSFALEAFAEAADLDLDRVIGWVQACAVKDTLWSLEFGESAERTAVNLAVASLGS